MGSSDGYLEQPAGLLPKFQLPAKFRAADPTFAGRHVVDDVKRLQKGELAPVEQGPGLRGFQTSTFGALPVILFNTLTIVAVAAIFALIAILPLQGCQVLHTAFLIGKPLVKLEQRQTLKPLFHNFLLTLSIYLHFSY